MENLGGWTGFRLWEMVALTVSRTGSLTIKWSKTVFSVFLPRRKERGPWKWVCNLDVKDVSISWVHLREQSTFFCFFSFFVLPLFIPNYWPYLLLRTDILQNIIIIIIRIIRIIFISFFIFWSDSRWHIIQGHPTTVFCKISVRRGKCCLEFSIAWERFKFSRWLFHSCQEPI